jgi:hypothetical protein
LNGTNDFRTIPVGKFKLSKFKISFGFVTSDLLRGFRIPAATKCRIRSVRVGWFASGTKLEVNEEGTEATIQS